MRKVLLVRYGEVFLKGANRPHFLKLLTDNVKRAVKPIGGKVWLSDSRIYVSDVEDMDEWVRRVRKVFGLYSVSPAIECEKDLDVIAEQCIEMMKGKRGSFKVYGKRSDKKFPMNSLEFAAELGGRILESNPHLTVDIHNPQHKLRVEIRDNCYICCEEIMAVGDSENDLDMIRKAGLGVAMANGEEIVRRHADALTLTNDEDGVAAAIEKYVLG